MSVGGQLEPVAPSRHMKISLGTERGVVEREVDGERQRTWRPAREYSMEEIRALTRSLDARDSSTSRSSPSSPSRSTRTTTTYERRTYVEDSDRVVAGNGNRLVVRKAGSNRIVLREGNQERAFRDQDVEAFLARRRQN